MNALAKPYDVQVIRRDFPILSREVYGKPLVYLDNAASAQKPNAVLDRIQQAYSSEYANVHRGLHYLANAATEAYEGAREKAAGSISKSTLVPRCAASLQSTPNSSVRRATSAQSLPRSPILI